MESSTAMESSTEEQWALIRPALARLRASVFAVVLGVICGSGLFVATAWLLIRGGPNVGKHLSLLNNYFPGYSVTWPGAFVGALYGAAVGAIIGYVFAWVYNTIALKRSDGR